MALTFPAIDPIALEIGPLIVRWYSLAYVVGIVVGWRAMLFLNGGHPKPLTQKLIDDFVLWATLAIVLGGRLGYILFYQPSLIVQDPLAALKIWEGGMSFHGGLLGMVLMILLISWRNQLSPFRLGDLVACVAPIGLFFGRIANFINGELFGRATDPAVIPWAMIFPRGGDVPRHPSQLYEAFLEGVVLFVVLFWLERRYNILTRPGLASGIFLTGYGLARFAVELTREPDAHLGFIIGSLTMGQLLSLPMIIAGGSILAYVAYREKAPRAS